VAQLEKDVAALKEEVAKTPAIAVAAARSAIEKATVKVGRSYGHSHAATIEP
jgi:hypothetical protein